MNLINWLKDCWFWWGVAVYWSSRWALNNFARKGGFIEQMAKYKQAGNVVGFNAMWYALKQRVSNRSDVQVWHLTTLALEFPELRDEVIDLLENVIPTSHGWYDLVRYGAPMSPDQKIKVARMMRRASKPDLATLAILGVEVRENQPTISIMA